MPFSQGQFCYKPNLQVSCCPQYTIKFYGIPFVPWIVVDSRPKIRCERIQALQKPETDSQSVGHLLIVTSSLSYTQCALCVQMESVHLEWWSKWHNGCGQWEVLQFIGASIYMTNLYFIPYSGLLIRQIQRQVRNKKKLLPLPRWMWPSMSQKLTSKIQESNLVIDLKSVSSFYLISRLFTKRTSSDNLRAFIIHSREIWIVQEISRRYTSRS